MSNRGRPRSFDREETLERACDAFWQNGYQHTSFADLERATGVHRQSLQNTFGSKNDLFLKALEFYIERDSQRVIGQLYADRPPLANLRAVAECVSTSLADAPDHGCMAVNTCIESGKMGGEIRGVLAELCQTFIAGIERNLRAGQDDGTIRRDFHAEDMARTFFATMQGLSVTACVMPEADYPKKAILRLVENVLSRDAD